MKKNRKSVMDLRFKTTTFIVAVIIVCFLLLTAANYLISYFRLREQILKRNELIIKKDNIHISTILDNIRKDLLQIKNVPPVHGIIRAQNPDNYDYEENVPIEFWYDRIYEIYSDFLALNKGNYDHIRFINQSGYELVSFNYRETYVESVQPRDLQYKGHRPYFKEAMKLKNGEINISDIDLNREHNQIEIPYKPVLRIATPVFNSEGEVQGVIVLNVLSHYIFDLFETYIRDNYKYVLNEKGYYLLYHDREEEFGFDLGFDNSIPTTRPELADIIEKNEKYTGMTKNPDTILCFQKLHFDPSDNSRYWVIAMEIPEKEAFEPINSALNASLILSLLLLLASVFIVAFFITRNLTTPLYGLTRYTKAIKNDEERHLLIPPDSGEEFRDLYATFNDYASLQRGYKKQLEEEVSNLTRDLRINAQNMRSILDIFPGAILQIESESRTISFFSKGAQAIFGYTSEEVIGKNAGMFMPESTQSKQEELTDQLLQIGTGRDHHGMQQIPLRRKNGDIFMAEVYISETMTIHGRTFTGIIKDISQELQISSERNRLYTAVEKSFEAIFITDTKGMIEYINPAFETVTGYGRIESIGQNPRMLKSGMMEKSFFKEMWNTILDGNVFRGEFINRRKNGEIYYFASTISPIRGEDGSITHFVSMNSDITERKRSEQKMEQTNRILEDSTKDNEIFLDILSIFNSIQDQEEIMEQILKLLAEQTIFISSVWYSYDEWQNSLHCLASYGGNEALRQDITIGSGLIGQIALDGKPVLLKENIQQDFFFDVGLFEVPPKAVIIQPVVHSEKLMGVLVLVAREKMDEKHVDFVDRLSLQLSIALQNLKRFFDMKQLSDQLKNQREEISYKNHQLKNANQMKSEFLANMSHELRTPLNAIIGFSEVLKDEAFGDLNTKQKEYLEDIFSSGHHLLSLINDILDLSKIEAGKMALDLEKCILEEIIKNSLTIIKGRALNHRISTSYKMQFNPGIISLDERKIKQILFNLLSNAVKFTPDGGAIDIIVRHTTENGAEYCTIDVKDTGIGIAKKDMDKLFAPFEQLDGSISRKFEGTGLGLSLVRSLTELHGGFVEVTSEVGHGSCFSVSLPLIPVQTTNSTEPNSVAVFADDNQESYEPDLKSEAPLIMIVEDDPNAVRLIEAQLHPAGFVIETADSAEKALELLKKRKPDIITLDLLLPGMNGYEFLGKIKDQSAYSSIPVVIVSIVADKQKGIAFGAEGIVQKPIRKEKLLKALEDVGIPVGSGRQYTILAVDDEPSVVKYYTDYLSQYNFKIIPAYGGKEAIDLAYGEEPDLILLDLMMPEVTGFDVVDTLKHDEATKDIPIIIVTAKLLTHEDVERLNGSVARLYEKRELNSVDFIGEIKQALSKQQKINRIKSISRNGKTKAGKNRAATIMVVEDNNQDAELISTYLQEEGYHVERASNGKEALLKLDDIIPDLISLDLSMPEMDGFAFLNAISKNEKLASVPVIIVSAAEETEKNVLLGVSATMHKPVNKERFLKTIHSVLSEIRKKNIMIVDDDPKAIAIFSNYLSDLDVKILFCYSGKEGLSLAKEEKPDLILLDLVMPEMDGFETLSRLKQDTQTSSIPIIIITSKTLSSKEKHDLMEHAELVAQKADFSKKKVVEEVEKLLRTAGGKKS